MSGHLTLPRIVIDGRVACDEVPHGFARYVAGLAAGLKRIEQDAPLAYEPIFLIQAGTAPRAFSGFGTCEVGAKFLSPFEILEIPRLLKKLGAAAYHSPTFSALRWAPCPWISTVHDLNHLQFGGFKEKLYYERLLKPFVKKAAAVASVSDFSRKEIGAWAGVYPKGIDLVYNSIDPVFAERADPVVVDAALAKYGLRKKQYFFSLSNSKPHKNLSTLLEGFRGHTAGWDLVLNLRAGELPAASGLKLIGPPSDEEARALMAGAGAVVFPSLYEGFGLPPVEAACLGVPILVSRIPPHREALADLEQGEALYVDPRDAAAWSKAMDRASRGEVLGASIESRSRLMRRFSVLSLGAHMDRIYRRVLKLP